MQLLTMRTQQLGVVLLTVLALAAQAQAQHHGESDACLQTLAGHCQTRQCCWGVQYEIAWVLTCRRVPRATGVVGQSGRGNHNASKLRPAGAEQPLQIHGNIGKNEPSGEMR